MKPATKVLDAEDPDPRAGKPTLEDKSVFFRFKCVPFLFVTPAHSGGCLHPQP